VNELGERFRLSNLTIEGFRGINKKISINLDGNAAVFFGPNGVGKSSIMQAIEWGLFGGLISAVIGSAEFKKEDAIVNSFHPQKKAIVEITLEGEKGKKVKVIRERKLGKSTTAGKTDLRVEIDDAEYSDDEAQLELNKLLRMTPREFYAGAYLHQEAIRDLIVGEPLLRSEVIDKLLGLHFVRELIDYLPLKHVTKEAKTIEQEIEDIKERKMQEVVISRKRLAELGAEMKKSGIEEVDLDPTSLTKHTQQASAMINEVAKKMKTEIKEFEEPSRDLKSSEKALEQMKKSVEKLENVWGTLYKESVNKTSNLKAMKQSYEEAMKEVASLETKDPKDLLTRKSEISEQISKIESQLKERISARKFLQDESIVVHHLYSNLDEARNRLEKIKKEFGDETNLKENVKNLQSQIDDRKGTIKREEALGSLLVSGLDYLKSTLPKNCPLCKSDIVYQNVVSILEKEIGERQSAKIVLRLQKELDEMKQKKAEIEDALGDFQKFKAELEKTQSKIDGEKQKLEQSGFEPAEDLEEYIASELEKINSQISDIDEEVRKLKSEAAQVDLKLEDLQKKIQKLSSIEKQLQKIIKTTETGEKLAQRLSEQIGDSEQNTKVLEGITEEIRASKNRLEICEKILGFLKEKDKVDKLEEGLPALQQRLKDLEEKYSKIKELEAGLTDIYSATTTAREEMVKKALAELQSIIGSYYSKILCHPYYVNLQLIPEEERGKAIYRIRAWDKEFKQGTYVQTRFSNAQMNAVALSLFLSMSTRLQSNLGIILLDDPSQSMDNVHKEALSKLLKDILQEKQLIVSTQDTEFEKHLEKLMPTTETMIYKLSEWSTIGPEISY
jgi:exonuclease SbcC